MRWVCMIAVALFGCADLRVPNPEEVCEPSADRVCSRVHAAGIQDPTSPDFHGNVVRGLKYDLETCKSCHGRELHGGAAEASCTSCHDEGVFACKTCHGQIQESGAHAVHLAGGSLGLKFTCQSCHPTPSGIFEAGHVLRQGELDPSPVEVRFDETATSSGAVRPPSWDPVTRTCSDVYCHGGTFEDAAATERTPTWRSGQTARCDRCHGRPPQGHSSDRCADCHGAVSDGVTILEPALHLDRAVQLGDGSGTCSACHVVSGPGHEGHLSPTLGLRGPMGCVDCHLTPTEVGSVGHLGPPPVEVFPPGFGGLAEARGATPTFENSRCSNTYCHGSSTVDFGGPPDQVNCGSCHAVPPRSPGHLASFRLGDCAFCHPRSVDSFGNPLIDADGSSQHINGVVDL